MSSDLLALQNCIKVVSKAKYFPIYYLQWCNHYQKTSYGIMWVLRIALTNFKMNPIIISGFNISFGNSHQIGVFKNNQYFFVGLIWKFGFWSSFFKIRILKCILRIITNMFYDRMSCILNKLISCEIKLKPLFGYCS